MIFKTLVNCFKNTTNRPQCALKAKKSAVPHKGGLLSVLLHLCTYFLHKFMVISSQISACPSRLDILVVNITTAALVLDYCSPKVSQHGSETDGSPHVDESFTSPVSSTARLTALHTSSKTLPFLDRHDSEDHKIDA